MTVEYTKTIWKNNSPPYINEDNLNNIENGIESTANEINAHEVDADIHFTAAERTKLNGIEAGATADQTGAEIKALYEAEADTNAFTDTEKSKLSGIEIGATADMTASEILTAIKSVDGAGSGLDADLLDGQHASTFSLSGHDHTGVYEPVFTKNTGFNKNLGTTAGTVSEGNHAHAGVYEPVISTKNSAFNKNFGSTADTVCQGNDSRLADARTPVTHTHTESDITDLGSYEPAFTKNTAFNKNFGTANGTVCQGNDSRLSDARTPTSHTHGHADLTCRPFSYSTGHTEWATGLSNEEINRIVLQTGEQLVVKRVEVQIKGGGSSASLSANVYDGTNTIGTANAGSVDTTGGTSAAAATVLIRLTNSTGSTQSASVTVSGWIIG
jgi:hypothetical protein